MDDMVVAPQSPLDDTTLVKKWARDLGFDAVGIAAALPYQHGSALTEWLERGFHGSMAYMARDVDRRLDPRKLLPDARSIVCVAKLYHTERADPGPHQAIVSSYAWGEDYHDVMGETLGRLADWIRESSGDGVEAKAYVDTGAILVLGHVISWDSVWLASSSRL